MNGKVNTMIKNMDKIQFESRREIETIMNAISKYVEQNSEENENETLKEFYGHLDIMHLSW
jgi:hypothetical protein